MKVLSTNSHENTLYDTFIYSPYGSQKIIIVKILLIYLLVYTFISREINFDRGTDT